SHELRTPLNAILGWAQILRRANSLKDVQEAVAVIERNAKTQARLIEDLLDVSRIVSGKVLLDPQQVQVDQAVEAAIDAVLPAAANKRVRINTDIEPYAGPVLGDPNRIQQVAANLLGNAIKFSRDGGEVRVRVAVDDGRVDLTVQDDGAGIEPELLPHIFDRFRTAEGPPGSAARRHAGLGLGLAIVKHLVELHNGTVLAESPGPGRGATFRVTFPLAVMFERDAAVLPGRAAAVCPADVPPTPPDLSGVRVLVVDDEADARLFIAHVLRHCGAEVAVAPSMPEALDAMDAGPFDVLVSDIAMPEHDGYELIHRVRQRPPDRGGLIRALALTAFARETDLRRSLSAGFNMHVSKPVDENDLLTSIGRLLKTRLGA
ncbi:MAG TPA: ATP-binding protein, partial [Humisphaera sp.]